MAISVRDILPLVSTSFSKSSVGASVDWNQTSLVEKEYISWENVAWFAENGLLAGFLQVNVIFSGNAFLARYFQESQKKSII